MSIADHFEQAPDARSIRDYDASTARRQFNLSLALVAVLALAAAALGTVVRFDLPAADPQAAAQPMHLSPMHLSPMQLSPMHLSAGASQPPAYAGKL